MSKSISHKQLSAPAAAAANAPPPKVHISFGEDKGHSSVNAIPPKVVASNNGISLGLATSSQAGSFTFFLEGTTCSRIEVWKFKFSKLLFMSLNLLLLN